MTPDQHKSQYQKAWSKIKSMPPDMAMKHIELLLLEANNKFGAVDGDTRFLVAYNYTLAADYASTFSCNVSDTAAEYLYHFAGHHFRLLENFNLAAEAYKKAGDCSKVKDDVGSLHWAIRSYARAKVCYQDIGESEKAAAAYYEEQEVRRRKFKKDKKRASYVWFTIRKEITNYGESFYKLFICFLILDLIFSLLYTASDYFLQWPDVYSWHSLLRGAYLYIAVSIGFGEIINNVPWPAKIIILLNIFSGYLLLALGIDIIIRKFKES